MRIRLLTSMAGPEWSGQHGETVDRPDAEAIWLIERGHAEPVRAAPPARAVAARREKAAG